MIPVRVLLKNFLCYAETADGQPMEFDFEGSRLWSISGDNGAGKSAIFDAITYTLFGEHRGGAQEDSRLIRKGAERCEAVFEFRLDGHLYKVRRTVGRPKGKARQEPKTWQAFQLDPAINDWRPIKETERAAQLNHWVQEKLGLRYETFVASVMLLQGQSDRLIVEPPKTRFNILSGLLDLEPYKRLETTANDRMKEARRRAEDLERRLMNIPAVTPEELEQAKAELQQNEEVFAQAQQTSAQAKLLVNEARRYTKLQNELVDVKSILAEKETLLQDAEHIRSEYQEWQKLSAALPKLRLALKDLQQAEQQTMEAAQERSAAAKINVEERERAKDTDARAEILAEERCNELRTQYDELNAAFPLLRDVVRCRREKEKRERALVKKISAKHWEAEIARLQTVQEEQQQGQKEAEAELKRAVEANAQAKAGLELTQRQFTTRLDARNEAVCSRCGQPVDPAHIQRELEEAEQAVEIARQRVETTAQTFQRAEDTANNVTSSIEDTNQQLSQAREALAGAQQAEKEWNDANKEFHNALDAACQVSADLLSVVEIQPLTDADAFIQKLNEELKDRKNALEQAEEDKKKASKQKSSADSAYHEALRKQDQMHAKANELDQKAQGLRQQATVRLTDIDALWQERVLVQDLRFIEALAERQASLKGIEEKYAALEKAAVEHEGLKMQLGEKERTIAEIRPEHKIPVARAEEKAKQAQQHFTESQKRRDDAWQALGILKKRQEDRQALETDAGEARRQRRLYTRLAELLGRNGLQSYLLDEAVRSITRLANETLTRISGGQLRIQIERGEEEISIQVTDLAFSEEPLDVKFISGSQKFRVSVALAAGVGQYVGRGVGSVRSLIIDEGFGSLDTQGRQEMIDELRNLSQFMDRIIIVSHQEDFQDRTLFPTGYVLRKVNQRTQVERFV
jgi:DNA repair protein SbcC/Rad50